MSSSNGTLDETNSTSTQSSGNVSGTSTEEEEEDHDDVGLNELSANYNNLLFASTIVGACVDAFASSFNADLPSSHDNNNNSDYLDDSRDLHRVDTELVGNTTAGKDEDRQHLLHGAGYDSSIQGEYMQAADESNKLWSKAMTTLAKGKGSTNNKGETLPEWFNSNENKSPAYDMDAILLDGSITGGGTKLDGRNQAKQENIRRSNKIIPSSDYSIDGESAIVWTDDIEGNYFKYMMDQEKQHRAELGKDQEDSLLGGSTRDELLHASGTGHQEGTSTFDEDDTTLGHGSKVFGWGSTVVGAASAAGNASTLTPSFRGATHDKNGRVIIPNVIYVSDGNTPDQKVTPRKWPHKGADQWKPKKRRATKKLDEDDEEKGGILQAPKSPCHAHRLLIAAALFFLLLTTGLVAALIIYRNRFVHKSGNSASSSAALGEAGSSAPYFDPNIVIPPSTAPIETPYPTVSIAKKVDETYSPTMALDAVTDDIVEDVVIAKPTLRPTFLPSSSPISAFPSFAPTGSPNEAPSKSPTAIPSLAPTKNPSTTESSQTPSAVSESEGQSDWPSDVPTTTLVTSSPTDSTPAPTVEDMGPTSIPTVSPTSSAPSTRPTKVPTMVNLTSAPSMEPTKIPTTASPTVQAPVPSYVALDTVRNFLLQFSPMSMESLFNEESPQFSALQWLQQWMASIPAQELGTWYKWRLVQRWALAVVYYSMDGQNWANANDWLGDLDVCDWLQQNNQGSCKMQAVINLDLSNNFLNSTLPKELSLLAPSLGKIVFYSRLFLADRSSGFMTNFVLT